MNGSNAAFARSEPIQSPVASPWPSLCVALGFALGGFFDGILLHQILQWHHLLSLVPGSGDIRWQVLWDGYFHLLMYVIALAALVALWRTRRQGAAARQRHVVGALLVGFGLWHVADALLAHWLLQIHRVKPDADDPLAWDVGWLIAFGVIPLATGCVLWLSRRGSPRETSSTTIIAVLILMTVASGSWAARPPGDSSPSVVVFRPGMLPSEAALTLAAADAALVWADPSFGVALVHVRGDRTWSLYARGALFVGGWGLPAGCLGWSRA